MITIDQYLHLKDQYPDEYNDEIGANAKELLDRVNKLLAMHQGQSVLRSGWRPAEHNKTIGGAPNSLHLTGCAVDVADVDGSLAVWLKANEKYMEDFQLWAEEPSYTKTWCHLQSKPPKSGKRFYIPY